jgi:lysine N6-hydroxylase
VSFDEKSGLFEVVTQRDRFLARHVCVGIGKQINLPDCVTTQDDTCFHASEMMLRTPDLAGKRVTVVGGGQSGADLFEYLPRRMGPAAEPELGIAPQ